MYHATISADVIASSSLSADEMSNLTKRILGLFARIDKYQCDQGREIAYHRLVSGDLIEFLIKDPNDALRIALIIKCGIKSYPVGQTCKDKNLNKYRKLFQAYGARVAIGIGEMNVELLKNNILNGDAINRSGRLIAEQKTSNKERVVIKNTLFFDSPIDAHTQLFSVIMTLLDELINKSTAKQSHILLLKLLGYNESQIAQKLHITQATVNQQSKAAGWNAIEQAVRYYDSFNFQNHTNQ